MRTTLMISLIASCVMVATPAHADLSKPKNAKARAHWAQGNRYYKVREFEKAIEEYKAGAIIEDKSVFAYNLGQANRQLGNYKEAIWYYRRFLSRGNVDPEVEMFVKDFIKVMKAELERTAMKKEPVAPAPDEVTKPTKTKPAGDRRDLTTTSEPTPRWYQDSVGWGLSGAGAAFLVGAGGYLLSASGLDDDADRDPSEVTAIKLRDRADDRRVVGAVLAVTGGVVVTAGIVKLLRNPGAKRRPEGRVAVGFGRNTLVIYGRF